MKFDLRVDGALPRYVEGDSQRISQILHNLLGNALKFTDQGAVTLRAELAHTSGFVRFSVIDSGPGLDLSVHDKIFEPFSQADGSVTRTKGGTGLGLSISRGLCDAMGGFLSVESRLGHGATFWFELLLPDRTEIQQDNEFEALAQKAPGSEPEEHDKLERILVVDDNATNRLLLRRYLRDTSAEIEEACDGAQAVDMALDGQFDLVLMDVQMPVIDGIAATKLIRDREAELVRAPTRIIAVTANVMTHQIAYYLESGVDDVLAKPISKRSLLDAIGAWQRYAA